MFAKIIVPIQALLLILTLNNQGYFSFYVTPSPY
jgi:hypothetical protein